MAVFRMDPDIEKSLAPRSGRNDDVDHGSDERIDVVEGDSLVSCSNEALRMSGESSKSQYDERTNGSKEVLPPEMQIEMERNPLGR
ncbi:hypothetical protein Dimus_036264, partial [Dionaea muscipula]